MAAVNYSSPVLKCEIEHAFLESTCPHKHILFCEIYCRSENMINIV